MKKCPECGAEESKEHWNDCSLGLEKKERMKQEIRSIQRELHELDRDKARLDWLEKQPNAYLSGVKIDTGKLREAIDAAMKEEP